MRQAIAVLSLCAVATFGAAILPQRGLVQEYDTIDEALAGNPSQLTDTYIIKGLHAINDGLAGKFYYLPSDTTSTTNETDCFAWGTGRLKRTFDGVTSSRIVNIGSSTNVADNLTISNYFRLLNVVSGLGSGNAAVFDAYGTLTNGPSSSGGGGSGNFTNYIILNGTNVVPINPTDNYFPVRVSTNGFGDGPIHVPSVGSTNIIVDGQVIFGPGTTNVLTKTGGDLLYTNGLPSPSITIVNGSGNSAKFSMTSGGGAVLQATSGQVVDLKDASQGVRLFSGMFIPISDGTISLGSSGTGSRWNDFSMRGTETIYGFESGANYSRLAVSHTGTNGAVVIDSQSAGTAGSPKPFNFNMGGTNFFALRQITGQPYLDVVNPITGTSGSITESSGSIIMGDSSAAGMNAGSATMTITSGGLVSLHRGTSDTAFDFYGFLNGGNYSRLKINHTGTNGAVVFDSQAAGTAGSPRPFVFTNGPAIYNKAPGWFTGTGTPEGSVTAPIGSFYSRTDGGAGTAFYVKESGTGNTGWVAK